MTLAADRQRLHSNEKLLRGKGIETGSNVLEDLITAVESECLGSEAVPEAVAAVYQLWESICVLIPGETTAIDHDTSKCGAVTSDPLGRRVDDNIDTVIKGLAEEAASAESVVHLYSISEEIDQHDFRTVSQSLARPRHGLLATALPNLVQ